ncbi:tryptophan halogenase family protein [Cellvibrio japonicus]|nr:tryptophan halogenase family protein [Cellvibrio japonicus]QEI13434.1 tryptophan 7-halogenase [Cellvibrio japonicus]QEI17008.1 tryptophan 7-halogenase [Cellvibrio japonicus]QEI20586.1 tryptophan 7-halogenase [Cellvibrio japonicus]
MKSIKDIVVLGGGTSGWIAAAMLAAHLKPTLCRVTVIESEELGPIGVGESTIPPILHLIHSLGIDEQDFMRETQACYKLGIKFIDWRESRHSYFHPYGSIGKRIENQDFYQCWLKASLAGEHYPLEDFSPCAVMAARERFFPPGQAQNTPIGGAHYAVHLDAKLVAAYLRRYAEARGVKSIQGKCVSSERDQRGFIQALQLQDGTRVDGDFFIDCSGFRALLIGEAMGVELEDWSHYLPCDRALVVKTDVAGSRMPYTTATARKAGWSWRIPLRNGTGHGYVYASRFCSDAEAKSTLLRHLDAARLNEPRLIHFTSGRRKVVWQGNCLALGLAAGFVEPLESTAIHLIVRGMDFFLRYFPDAECEPSLARAYNRRIAADYEEVRDFILLHYCTSRRNDSDFWRWCRQMPIPDSLQERIALFTAHGLVPEASDELFRSSNWQSVFEGMGIRPHKYCPRVDNLDYVQIRETLQLARTAIAKMVEGLPSHDEYLARQFPRGF